MPADITIRNATILDGSGGPGFAGDVTVRGDRIERVGEGAAATLEIDAGGLALAPGFVDTHSHDDSAFIRYPGMEFKLAQGCTSVVSGNCGFSAAPADPGANMHYVSGGILGNRPAEWTDLEGYFAKVMTNPPAINNMMLVGHNTMRSLLMENERRQPTADEYARMRAWVAQAMEQGACGLSTGLIYEPGRYSTTEEVIELAREVAPFGGLYATHMRNEAELLLDAVNEALRIGREAGIGVHISHHKSAGAANWGKVGDSLAVVDAARVAGQEVTLDVYPYTAGSGRMFAYFRLDNISEELARVVRIANCPDFREFEGRMVTEIAADKGLSLQETVRMILTSPRGGDVVCIQFIIDEPDIETNLRHPKMMIGSDGIPNLNGMPHPRLFGTMPRVLGEYVRERGIIPLEEAVRRMTSLACDRFGLTDRGRVREGGYADLVLFDPATVKDMATYDQPKLEPVGIHAVIVNGRVAYSGGTHTGVGSGRMLRYRMES